MRSKSFILGSSLIAVAALVAGCASQPKPADSSDMVTAEELAAAPDATIDFEATQVRLIIGGGVGSGVLHFKGTDYPFTIKAATVGGIGVTDIAGVGNVFHLSKVEDFPGTYAAAGIGAAFSVGKGASAFKNTKGVVVQTKGKATGLALNMGVGGVEVKMGKPN